jgi:hypothetical protein
VIGRAAFDLISAVFSSIRSTQNSSRDIAPTVSKNATFAVTLALVVAGSYRHPQAH